MAPKTTATVFSGPFAWGRTSPHFSQPLTDPRFSAQARGKGISFIDSAEMAAKFGSLRHTGPDLAGGVSSRIRLSKIDGLEGPQYSGPELLEYLREQRLVRIAAGHADPYFANSDLNQRTDFEYLEPDR